MKKNKIEFNRKEKIIIHKMFSTRNTFKNKLEVNFHRVVATRDKID